MRRDIARALRAIGERHAKLCSDGSLSLKSPDAAPFEVPAPAVMAMVSEGLLVRVRDEVRRTGEGRAFLRRALASAADEPFGEQHRIAVPRVFTTEGRKHTATANAAECPLSMLLTRKGKDGKPLVSDTQHAAGMRLARDFERAHARQSVTQSWDASGVRGTARRDGLSTSEAAAAARTRVEDALDAVGSGLAEILVTVCCEEIGLEAAERRFGWPARSAKVVLQLALDRLCDHYGMAAAARGRASGFVHWGAEGYRPKA